MAKFRWNRAKFSFNINKNDMQPDDFVPIYSKGIQKLPYIKFSGQTQADSNVDFNRTISFDEFSGYP